MRIRYACMHECMHVKVSKCLVFLRNPENASEQSSCVSHSPGLDPKTRFCKGVSAELNTPVCAPPSIPLSWRRRQFPMKVSTDQYFFPLALASSSGHRLALKFVNNTLSPNSWLQCASVYHRWQSYAYVPQYNPPPDLSSTHITLNTWLQSLRTRILVCLGGPPRLLLWISFFTTIMAPHSRQSPDPVLWVLADRFLWNCCKNDMRDPSQGTFLRVINYIEVVAVRTCEVALNICMLIELWEAHLCLFQLTTLFLYHGHYITWVWWHVPQYVKPIPSN
jgi:hypothetical protein